MKALCYNSTIQIKWTQTKLCVQKPEDEDGFTKRRTMSEFISNRFCPGYFCRSSVEIAAEHCNLGLWRFRAGVLLLQLHVLLEKQ
jgi:hypothetical protein